MIENEDNENYSNNTSIQKFVSWDILRIYVMLLSGIKTLNKKICPEKKKHTTALDQANSFLQISV